jgi:hypothetical protein
VSLACLAVTADAYEAAGGLSGAYLGEGEEVGLDLCARIARLGREAWCCADARMFRLGERDAARPVTPAERHYDEWLLGHRAGELLSPPREPAGPHPRPNGAATNAAPAGPVPARWRGADRKTGTERPSVRGELEALIRAELEERGIDPAELLDPTRAPSGLAALSRLRLRGTRILELGAGLGEISRALRRQGAALVDACESDPASARLARLLHARHGASRISVWRDASSLEEKDQFDLLLALGRGPHADLVAAAERCRAAVVRHEHDDALSSELPFHAELDAELRVRARLEADLDRLLARRREAARR